MAYPVFAALVTCGGRNQTACTLSDIFTTVALVISFLLGASSLVAILFIVIGGVQMIFSGGNPKAIETGKQTLFNAILGLLIVLGAFFIINLVLSRLSGGTISLTNIEGFFGN
ncbi:MAG: hypothetical protein ACM3NH_03445 [Candidatus Saccharibacteria bacterium]